MDASPGGTVAPVNRIRLAASANPGPADPNPPTWAVQPTSIVAMPVNPGFPSTDWDLAVVFANVDWSDRGIYRFGLWVGEPSTLTGLPFMARGYGINVDDQECDTNGTTMGAGQARQGFDFVVQFAARAGLAGAYSYNNWSTNNQAVMCGDSGGPDHANIGPEDFVWTHLIGIHSTGKLLNTPVQSSVTGRWVQDTIGGTYLSSDSNRDLNVARLDSPLFGPMWQMVNKADPRAVRMFYDPATQAIQGAGRCMQQSGANVLARSCTPSTSTSALDHHAEPLVQERRKQSVPDAEWNGFRCRTARSRVSTSRCASTGHSTLSAEAYRRLVSDAPFPSACCLRRRH